MRLKQKTTLHGEALACLLLLMPLMAIPAPRMLAYAVPVMVVVFGLLHIFHRGGLPEMRASFLNRPVILGLCLLILWSMMGGIWRDANGFTASRLFQLSGMLFTSVLLILVMPLLSRENLSRLAAGLPYTVVLGALLVLSEYHFNFPLYRLVHGTVVGEAVDRVELNRGTVVLVLFFWPAAYAMYRDGLQRRIVTLFLLLLMAILVPNSSQTALVGLLLGAAVFFLCRIHARLVSRTIMALVVICFLAAPFLAQALYVQRDNLPPWKEAAMKQRVTIWKVVSDKIFEKPVAGWGYEATRNAASDVVKHVQPYRWKKVMHPHNMPLQVWVDFGAVGVAIAVFILLAIFLYLERLPATAFPFGFGLFSSALLMGSIGYGAWQSWWLGALGISAALVAALMPQRDG